MITDCLSIAEDLREALSAQHVPQCTLGDTERGVKVVLSQNYCLDGILNAEIHHCINSSSHLVLRQNLEQKATNFKTTLRLSNLLDNLQGLGVVK